MIISSGIFHCTRRVLSSCLHPDLCAHQPHGHARRQWNPNRFVKFCLDKSRCLCLDNSDKLTLALFCQARFFCIGAASMHVFLMKSSANLARWYFSLFFIFIFFFIGLPDPFAKVVVDGSGQCHSTDTVRNTLDPKWNQHYDLWVYRLCFNVSPAQMKPRLKFPCLFPSLTLSKHMSER